MNALIGFLTFLVAVLLCVIVVLYVRSMAILAEQSNKYRDEFYQIAEKITNAPSDLVPLDVIKYLRILGQLAISKTLVPKIVLRLVWRRLTGKKAKNTPYVDRIEGDIQRLQPEIKKLCEDATALFVLSAIHNNVFFGAPLRRAVFPDLLEDAKNTAVEIAGRECAA